MGERAQVHGIRSVFHIRWLFDSHHDRRSTLQPMGFISTNPSGIPVSDIAIQVVDHQFASSNANESPTSNANMGLLDASLVSALCVASVRLCVCAFRASLCPLASVPESQNPNPRTFPNQTRVRHSATLTLTLTLTVTLARARARTAGSKKTNHPGTLYTPQYNNRLGRSAKKRKKKQCDFRQGSLSRTNHAARPPPRNPR